MKDGVDNVTPNKSPRGTSHLKYVYDLDNALIEVVFLLLTFSLFPVLASRSNFNRKQHGGGLKRCIACEVIQHPAI